MTSDQWERLKDLFDKVVDLSEDRRAAILERECPNEPSLRRRVESLVAHGNDNAVAHAVEQAAAETFDGDESRIGQLIGTWRISSILGQGGMGTVYLASRGDDEYHRDVAIKVARTGRLGREALYRFRSERQILANLQHPNIAQMFDGGADRGVPYVVMEYVKGLPLLEYCNKQTLSIERRIDLFLKVCLAVQHAHRNLIVHRDIKPGNILVNDAGEPKLLDFGIAKLLGPEDSQLALETGSQMRLLTPEYASPEQVLGQPITTATDVYLLGILLYEMITGHRPHNPKTANPFELERAVCEVDPDKPSTRFAKTDPEAARTIARERSIHPAELQRKLSGDLDNIVMKALRREPDRRYSSVEQLADDVLRYLQGFPVLARDASWKYRAAKFVHRHKTAAGSAAAFVLLLVSFSVGMTVLATRLAAERNLAQQTSTVLKNLLRISDPNESRGATVTAREIFDKAAVQIGEDLSTQPELLSSMRMTIGEVYQGLGLHSRAEPLLRQSLESRVTLFGEESAEAAATVRVLAQTVQYRARPDEAEELFRRSLTLHETVYGKDSIEVSDAKTNLAGHLRVRGKLDEAITLYRAAVEVKRRLLGDTDLKVAETEHRMAQALHDRAEYGEAEQLFRKSLETRKSLMPYEHPVIADHLNNLALLLNITGRPGDAEPLFRESLALRVKTLGPEHMEVANSKTNLGDLLMNRGRESEAESLLRDAVAARIRIFGRNNRVVSNSMRALGETLHRQGRFAEAHPILEEALDVATRVNDVPFRFSALLALGRLQRERGDLRSAETTLKQALDLATTTYTAEHPRTANAMAALGQVYRNTGNPGAESLLRGSLEIMRRKNTPGSVAFTAPLQGLGMLLLERGDAAAAEPLLREALDIHRRWRGPVHPTSVAAAQDLAACLEALDRAADARALLKEIAPR